MNLLSILDFGIGNLIALSSFFFIVAGIYGYQAVRAHNSGTKDSNKKIPYTEINQTWIALAVVLIYFGVLFGIKKSYEPRNPSKYGVPTEQKDSTRKAAEDFD